MEFALTEEEQTEFRKNIKSETNGVIPIQVEIDRLGKVSISIHKKGIAGSVLTKKRSQIAEFIARRVVFNYIPAIRTDSDAMNVIQSLVFSELRLLERKDEYNNALKVIADIRKPLLQGVSKVVKESLREFIPSIKDVIIDYDDLYGTRRFLRGNIDVVINDGVPTSLEYKGDGVKSLVTLGLLKNRFNTGVSSIIAIEEPESHLHPLAIHRLKEIVSDLSTKSQVIISSHNPLFVNRNNLEENVLVERGKAISKPTIKKIRESLGVKASDNLINAGFAILVEGETDVIIIKKMIEVNFPQLSNLVEKGDVLIYAMTGIKNLKTTLHLFETCVCEIHLIADDDNASKNAIQQALKEELINSSSYNILKCKGQDEAEIEDLFEYSCSLSVIEKEYGIKLSGYELNGRKKWSEKVKKLLENNGKILTEKWEVELKYKVANEVIKDINKFYDETKCSVLKNVLKEIEKKCVGKKNG